MQSSVVPRSFSDFAFDPTAEPQHLPTVEEEVENIAHDDIGDIENADDDPPGCCMIFVCLFCFKNFSYITVCLYRKLIRIDEKKQV